MRIHYRNVAITDANFPVIIDGIIAAEADALTADSSAVSIRQRFESRRERDATK